MLYLLYESIFIYLKGFVVWIYLIRDVVCYHNSWFFSIVDHKVYLTYLRTSKEYLDVYLQSSSSAVKSPKDVSRRHDRVCSPSVEYCLTYGWRKRQNNVVSIDDQTLQEGSGQTPCCSLRQYLIRDIISTLTAGRLCGDRHLLTCHLLTVVSVASRLWEISWTRERSPVIQSSNSKLWLVLERVFKYRKGETRFW